LNPSLQSIKNQDTIAISFNEIKTRKQPTEQQTIAQIWEGQDPTSHLVIATLLQNLNMRNTTAKEAPIQHALILVLVRNDLFYIHLVISAVTVSGMKIRSCLVLENGSSKIVKCMLAKQITMTGCIPEKSGWSQEINSCLLKTSKMRKSSVDVKR